jgi:hypothetical protein
LIQQYTVVENIQLPLTYQGSGEISDEDMERTHELARLVGLDTRLEHRPNQLSGGQQQRVAIARSLINDPYIILADEATGNLDSATSEEIMTMLGSIDRADGRVLGLEHPRAGTVLDDLAVPHPDDPLGMLGDVFFVGDHDDGLAGVVEPAQHVHDLLAGGGVEVAGGLVGEDDVRVVDQRSGDRHPLLLTAGELIGPVVQPVGEPDHPGHVDRPLLVLLREFAAPLVGQGELDVLGDGVLLDQVVRLEDEADVSAPDLRELVVVELGDITPAVEVVAAAGTVEATEQVEHGALARARLAHDGDVLALVEVDGDAFERVHGDGVLPAAAGA